MFVFCIAYLKAQKTYTIEIDTVSVLLQKLLIKDSLFVEGVDSLVLKYNLHHEERRKDYVYAFYLKKDSMCYYDISVELVPRYILGQSDILGYFRINNSLCFVRGDKFDDIFCKSKECELLYYTTEWVKLPDKRFRFDTLKPEEFSMWFLSYKNGKMMLKDKAWVPSSP